MPDEMQQLFQDLLVDFFLVWHFEKNVKRDVQAHLI